MTQVTFLVTRPEYDYTTRYISTWAQKVIKHARGKGHFVLDLEGNRARKKEIESVIKKKNPSLIFLNGHGNDSIVTGQDGEILIEAGKNEAMLKGAIVYALSCRSAKVLGVASVQQGTRAYIGYEEDFIFMYNSEMRTRPAEDNTALLFLDPSSQVMFSLLKGHNARDSQANTKKVFMRTIQKLLTSQTSRDDTAMVRYLLWDMRNLVCRGDPAAAL